MEENRTVVGRPTAERGRSEPERMESVTHHGPSGINKDAFSRLRSIEGQVAGIRRMVTNEAYCVDIITQIRSVRAALNKVGLSVLKRHIEHCVSDAIVHGGGRRDEIIEELMSVFERQEL